MVGQRERERCRKKRRVLVTEGAIRVCMYMCVYEREREREREFSWRKQAVQLCVCCFWSHAKNLQPATGTQ